MTFQREQTDYGHLTDFIIIPNKTNTSQFPNDMVHSNAVMVKSSTITLTKMDFPPWWLNKNLLQKQKKNHSQFSHLCCIICVVNWGDLVFGHLVTVLKADRHTDTRTCKENYGQNQDHFMSKNILFLCTSDAFITCHIHAGQNEGTFAKIQFTVNISMLCACLSVC